MAPYAATGSTSTLLPVLEILDQCDDVCRRLSTWCAAHHPSDGPLTVLLYKHTKALVAEVHSLRARISELPSDVDGGTNKAADGNADGGADPTKLIRALSNTKRRLLELLELHRFHKREEREGHDGALNVLFARRFILSGIAPPNAARAYYNEDKLIRIGLGLKDLLQEVLPASVLGGTACKDTFQQFVPKMEEFFTGVERQFHPRYVHTYDMFVNTPYIIDVTASPCSGSYGVVRKADHRRTSEALAIKTFSKIFDDKTTRKILREIGILEVCDHKNIVRLVEAFRTEDDDQAMHLVIAPWAPCTLNDFLQMSEPVRATRCTWFQPGSLESDLSTYRIMYELADAVHYLHINEIKHKDIKPENILLYREGYAAEVTPLITDFGVSKVFNKNAQTNYTDSTWVYLAPEQLHRESSTLKADIWQLGCCFAHLLALAGGGKPSHDKLLNSYMRSADTNCSHIIANEHSPFMDTLSKICMRGNSAMKRMYGVVSGMLELDPSQRLDIGWVRNGLARYSGHASA